MKMDLGKLEKFSKPRTKKKKKKIKREGEWKERADKQDSHLRREAAAPRPRPPRLPPLMGCGSGSSVEAAAFSRSRLKSPLVMSLRTVMREFQSPGLLTMVMWQPVSPHCSVSILT